MRKPYWLKRKIAGKEEAAGTKKIVEQYNLNTVCDSARCPNKGECYEEGTATFIVLGNICTRNCTFCAVEKNVADICQPDENEPLNIALATNKLGLDYLVVTMVTRDDLPDGGSEHLAKIIRTVRKNCKPGLLIEVLTSDFQGDEAQLAGIAAAKPDVFNHNMETINRLYPQIRPQADYRRSLQVLKLMKSLQPAMLTKSGFMVGFGETKQEVESLMNDLRSVKVDMLTIGQYLAPSNDHYPVAEYVHPDVFHSYREYALAAGFAECVSGPYVRSSYKASYAKKYVS